MDRLLSGATTEFMRLGGAPDDLVIVRVPGAFELTVAALAMARASSGRPVDAVVALGCLIRGETAHDRVIADAVAQGLIRVSLETGVPTLFGVLTVETFEQAEARAGGVAGNKGAEAMASAVEIVRALTGFSDRRPE